MIRLWTLKTYSSGPTLRVTRSVPNSLLLVRSCMTIDQIKHLDVLSKLDETVILSCDQWRHALPLAIHKNGTAQVIGSCESLGVLVVWYMSYWDCRHILSQQHDQRLRIVLLQWISENRNLSRSWSTSLTERSEAQLRSVHWKDRSCDWKYRVLVLTASI